MKEKQPILLQAVLKHSIWGGNRLHGEFGYNDPDGNNDGIGECWGIAAHPNGDNTVISGEYKGMKLSELWNKHPELFGNTGNDRFPLLVKIIDAKSDLSIQVHPDDVYADRHENGSLGKTECWYIMDCGENASLVMGHNARTRDGIAEMINGHKWKELIREVPIHKGDFFQINPGTVHAIKGGTLIRETQQNSDITYRVYDYDRPQNGKPRELHVRQSIDVITVPAAPVDDCRVRTQDMPADTLNKLYDCRYYTVYKIDVNKGFTFSIRFPFMLMSVLSGNGTVNGMQVRKGDHMLLPAGTDDGTLTGSMEMIASVPADSHAGIW